MVIAAAGAVLVSIYFAAQMFWLPTLASRRPQRRARRI
jgi:hypothetical protein